MNFDEYQHIVSRTAVYGKETQEYKLMYICMGLAGESGEVIEKLKKVVRNDDGVVTEEKRADLEKELGDVLWYLSELARALGLSLDAVAQGNITKLADREKRNVIKGEGDNR